MTGKQLSQNKIDTTSRDANLTRDSINASSTRIADTTGTDLLGKPFFSLNARFHASSGDSVRISQYWPATPAISVTVFFEERTFPLRRAVSRLTAGKNLSGALRSTPRLPITVPEDVESQAPLRSPGAPRSRRNGKSGHTGKRLVPSKGGWVKATNDATVRCLVAHYTGGTRLATFPDDSHFLPCNQRGFRIFSSRQIHPAS